MCYLSPDHRPLHTPTSIHTQDYGGQDPLEEVRGEDEGEAAHVPLGDLPSCSPGPGKENRESSGEG